MQSVRHIRLLRGRHASLISLIFLAGIGATPTADGQQATVELPRYKQTSVGLYVTAKQAYEKWQAESEQVKILDVRTTEEYLFVGHARMALSIPFVFQTYQWDASRRKLPMRPNPDFLAQVNEVVSPDDTVLVMCRSGARSALAVNQLVEAGYRNVFNIVDGMEGDTVDDPESVFHGQRMKNGWKNSGLPWTYDLNPNQMLTVE